MDSSRFLNEVWEEWEVRTYLYMQSIWFHYFNLFSMTLSGIQLRTSLLQGNVLPLSHRYGLNIVFVLHSLNVCIYLTQYNNALKYFYRYVPTSLEHMAVSPRQPSPLTTATSCLVPGQLTTISSLGLRPAFREPAVILLHFARKL